MVEVGHSNLHKQISAYEYVEPAVSLSSADQTHLSNLWLCAGKHSV